MELIPINLFSFFSFFLFWKKEHGHFRIFAIMFFFMKEHVSMKGGSDYVLMLEILQNSRNCCEILL